MMKFSELKNGLNHITFAIIKAEEKEGNNNRNYALLTCTDGSAQVEMRCWKTLKELHLPVPVVVSAEVEQQLYAGKISYILKDFSITCENPREYTPHAPIDPKKAFEEIKHLVMGFKNEVYRTITFQLLVKNYYMFMMAPAAKKIHHNYENGLLYHEYRMLKMAQAIVSLYPDINEELLYSGILLHDIGKIKELTSDEYGTIDYTIEGNLLGHCIIGIQMIDRESVLQGFTTPVGELEEVLLLKHLLASHHGELEFGAITKPATQEAMLLHELDMMESQKWQYEKAYTETEAGTLSEKLFGLGVKVYHSLN